jgi:ornithine decarboxylase
VTVDSPCVPTAKIERFLRTTPPATPFVVVDTDVVADRYTALTSALPSARVYYAVKANPARPVLECLRGLGSAFDVASPAEIDLCLSIGVPPEDISYGNTVKKRRDVAYAASCGVTRYTVDAPEELDKVASEAPGASICVRMLHHCGGSDWPLSRKFGCEGGDAARLLADATKAHMTCGVSFHVGSQQRDVDAWDDALARAARVFAMATRLGGRPSFLNLGGGFPGHYLEPVAPISAYGAAISASLREHFGDRVPELMVEPGRYLVADAGVLRSEVILVSRRSPDDDQRWVYLDCGKFHGLAETMDEAIRYRLRTPHDGGATGPVAIAGPTCDSADVLYDKTGYELPLALSEGDAVDIMSAGAYTTTYSSVGFNGFAPLAEYYL